jgi:hypothetical protein
MLKLAQPLPAGQEPPDVSATGAPKLVAPSWNWTVPVGGVTPPVEVTSAVNVTFCVTRDGLSEEVTTVVVPFCVTVCVNAALVLGSKLPSPLYSAVMLLCVPLVSAEVVQVA